MKFDEVIRVRSSPQSSVYLEALVTFHDNQDRDFIFSKARNLSEYRGEDGAPTAGIRLDIPPYLLPTFKLLNEHGFDIRNASGPDTKRYIKFDDHNLSLYLEVRLPGKTNWIKIRPEQARGFVEEKDRADYSAIRNDLLKNPARRPQNANLIPLGSRSANNSLPTAGPSAGTTSSAPIARNAVPKWVPPPRTSPIKRNGGYSLRNQK